MLPGYPVPHAHDSLPKIISSFYCTWKSANAQLAQVCALRTEKGIDNFRCCQRWACIRVISVDEMTRAIEDAAAACDACKQFFRMYVRSLYLNSLKSLTSGKPRKDAEKKVGTYQHPVVVYGMCQKMFCLLLSIDRRKLRRMVPSMTGGGRQSPRNGWK